MKKFLTVTSNVLFGIMLVVMVVLVFFLIMGKMHKDGVPKVVGYQMYIVLSGSMRPVFDAGSVLMVKPLLSQDVRTGDIITFKDPEDQKKIITHRVMEVQEGRKGMLFVTKGDANNAPDSKPVPGENVIGKVSLSVPYAGYLLDFAKSKKGLIVMIVIPGAVFIIMELFHLYKLALRAEEEEKRKKAEITQAEAARLETGS